MHVVAHINDIDYDVGRYILVFLIHELFLQLLPYGLLLNEWKA